MQIGIIGTGAIGSFVRRELTQRGFELRALLVRTARVAEMTERHPEMVCVSTVSDLPDNVDLIIDCAGQQALKSSRAGHPAARHRPRHRVDRRVSRRGVV